MNLDRESGNAAAMRRSLSMKVDQACSFLSDASRAAFPRGRAERQTRHKERSPDMRSR